MKNINIEAIIASKASNIQTKLSLGYKLGGNETLTLSQAKAAIKEILEAVIDKCAEKANVREQWWDGDYSSKEHEMFHENGDKHTFSIDKESILKVKEMINY